MAVIGTILRTLWVSLGCLAAAAAGADQASSRWSFGTQIGQVRGSDDSRYSAGELSTMSYDVAATLGDENRLGWRVFTGYRFTDHLAIHVGYADLGKRQARFVDAAPASFATPDGLVAQTVRGVDLGLQLKVPLSERFAVELRGGKYFWKSWTRVAAPWAEPDVSTQRDSEYFFGAGMEIGVIDDLNATLGWTRYQVAGEPIALWTVGVLYGFGYF